ncbi:hypothetical protein GCM10010269_43180 [Streptomyces humidus]|uniref:Uncharacterized protein n=1 Tax=Streptomyces humidus TaxID=52259 RepID=A0A918L493_9ACTN|nr:hypothetical protein GCM10010269_43180 [Streptomyces humidus]
MDVTAQWRGLRGDARVKPAFAAGLARQGDGRVHGRQARADAKPELSSASGLASL